jgi:hypothetical protein
MCHSLSAHIVIYLISFERENASLTLSLKAGVFLLKDQIMIFLLNFQRQNCFNGQQVLHLTSTTHSETTSLHPSTIH